MGSVLLTKDCFSKELAALHRKQTISTSAWVAFSFSSVSLCGLNKLLPSRSEVELMIYGSTGTTLVFSRIQLFRMEPYVSV